MRIEWPVRLAHEPSFPVRILFAQLRFASIEPALPLQRLVLQHLRRNPCIYGNKAPALLVDIPFLLNVDDLSDFSRTDNVPYGQRIRLAPMLRAYLNNLARSLYRVSRLLRLREHNVLSEAKEARDTVKASRQIVQVGTQHRSQPYPLAVRDIIRSGKIGKIVHIEQEWNVNEERWRFVPVDTGISPEMLKDESLQWKSWLYGRKSQLREEDTDWKRWLMGKPDRPFDPHVYLEFRLYKEFSSGIYDQWLSHGSDLVHLWSEETHPTSVTATGGIFVWPDGRENPDTCVAAVTYPSGFLYTYKTTFGNSYRSFARICGRDGTIENYGGEGASLFVTTKEGGRNEWDPWESGPVYHKTPLIGPAADEATTVQVPGGPAPSSLGPDDDDVAHIVNWLDAMRTRKQPNATVDNGFSHAIVCIMAAQSYWSGKRLYWDPVREEIVDQL